MKSVLIMRHAKSGYPPNQTDDFKRPLNKRGARDAPRMAPLLLGADPAPDHLLCSSAQRARETATGLSAAGFDPATTHFDDRIYLASAEELAEVISELPAECECGLLIGHNPGLEQLVERISGCRLRLPTAAIAAIDLECSEWSRFYQSEGELRWFVTPRLVQEIL